MAKDHPQTYDETAQLGEIGLSAGFPSAPPTPAPTEEIIRQGFPSQQLRGRKTAITSTDETIAPLLSGLSWTGKSGEGVRLTRSYTTSSFDRINVPSTAFSNTTALTTAQQAKMDQALLAWSSVANITWAGAAGEANFNIEFAALSPSVGGTTNWYYGSSNPDKTIKAIIAFNRAVYGSSSFSSGTELFKSAIHEAGHGLGFKHVGNYNGVNGSTPGPYLPPELDSWDTTVMSYTPGAYADAAHFPTTPMLFDIKAMQYLHGPNLQYNSGNTTWTIPASGSFSATLWDAGGTDQLDASLSAANNVIDLREGVSHVSTVGNVYAWVAFGAKIENARAGAGNDTLHGNGLDNQLTGGAGFNRFVLTGNSTGHDTVTDFKPGQDILQLPAGVTIESITENAGDSVIDIGNGNTVTLWGVPAAALTAQDLGGAALPSASSSVTATAAPTVSPSSPPSATGTANESPLPAPPSTTATANESPLPAPPSTTATANESPLPAPPSTTATAGESPLPAPPSTTATAGESPLPAPPSTTATSGKSPSPSAPPTPSVPKDAEASTTSSSLPTGAIIGITVAGAVAIIGAFVLGTARYRAQRRMAANPVAAAAAIVAGGAAPVVVAEGTGTPAYRQEQPPAGVRVFETKPATTLLGEAGISFGKALGKSTLYTAAPLIVRDILTQYGYSEATVKAAVKVTEVAALASTGSLVPVAFAKALQKGLEQTGLVSERASALIVETATIGTALIKSADPATLATHIVSGLVGNFAGREAGELIAQQFRSRLLDYKAKKEDPSEDHPTSVIREIPGLRRRAVQGAWVSAVRNDATQKPLPMSL